MIDTSKTGFTFSRTIRSVSTIHANITKKLIVIVFILIPIYILPITAQNKNSIYHNKKGWEHLTRGNNFKAILAFKEALKINPKYIKAAIGLGKAYLNTEAFTEALKLFNNALKIENDNIDAINGIAFAMIGLGRYGDALKYFDRVLTKSEENLNARYGNAYIYYLMDKLVWSKRKLKNILKINPYHYPSLLLMADIKIIEERLDEAKQYLQKAIDSNNELPDGYIKYSIVYLKEFKKTENIERINEAINELNKALAIHPENLKANRYIGYISLLNGKHKKAVEYFKKALSNYPDNAITHYNLGIAYENNNMLEPALNSFTKALKLAPADSVLQTKLEDFLVLHDYAIGHPLRVKFSNEHYEAAIENQKKNLTNDAIMHLRRSLLLNPMNRNSRESLRDNYLTYNFYRFYIEELKTLLNIYPGDKYQDILSVAIIKRRDKLFHKAGYSKEMPPRDVPNVLVLDFQPYDEITSHPDAGIIFSNSLTYTLSQFGRMRPFGVKTRLKLTEKLKPERKNFGDNLELLAESVKKKEIDKIDYIIFGTFRENTNMISIHCELLDFHSGVIISNFNISENGIDNISKLSIRVSKRLYELIPYKGRVLKTDTKGLIINLGLFDGVKPGDLFKISKLKSPEEKKTLNADQKLIFVINESDTLISSAKPLKDSDSQLVNINDIVYPLKKRRSKLIK